MKVILIGATGLVGKELLENLLQTPNIQEVTTITRKKILSDNKKLNQIVYTDLSPKVLQNLNLSGDHFICCLGTTIKAAKTKEQFQKIDFHLVLEFGKMAERARSKSLHIISSKGANTKSLFFYNKTKGEMEEQIKQLKISAIFLYRPSLLVGNRSEKRVGESFAIGAYQLLKNIIPKRYQQSIGTETSALVKTMALKIQGHEKGMHIIESTDI